MNYLPMAHKNTTITFTITFTEPQKKDCERCICRYFILDTLYWIAITNPKDQWHQKAVEIRENDLAIRLVTTEAVLIELLNYFSSYGSRMRQVAVNIVRAILSSADLEVIPHTNELFLSSLALYEQRLEQRL
ncbi:hypothetical protein Ple7327_2189 [Pleurocapsa sp. PCC 7327]|uniref:type II toxin-antitoxin system VapC family toxin n=1 Tax=Pleurocapsa sp. PCC 7327 TaxID=118163 RepID=UPI00029FBE8E|nr:hypothetical protein [Pleurocapsa sp. PCC 7327]AFY77507.1 hypothetical protein Ple7327_2189 [Pleurocapsa sp. PCC 7327]